MAAIFKEYKAKKDSMEKQAKYRKALIQKADDILTLLLKENKMLQSKNERLQKSIALCTQSMSGLEQQMTDFGEESVNLKYHIFTCEKENSEWEHLVDQYEGRIVKYEDLHEDLSDRRICEKPVAKKTRESIVTIVSIVGDNSQDEDLLEESHGIGRNSFLMTVFFWYKPR
jgi:septal ring factor EnvC (AmiA/AmiB activator)